MWLGVLVTGCMGIAILLATTFLLGRVVEQTTRAVGQVVKEAIGVYLQPEPPNDEGENEPERMFETVAWDQDLLPQPTWNPEDLVVGDGEGLPAMPRQDDR